MKTKTKTPNYNLTWYVYRHNINKDQIYKYNIFDHGRFSEEVYELISKRDMTYEEFSEKLRCSLMYYFWCKAEHEIVITSFPPYIDKKEFDRISSEESRILSNVRLRCGEKIDIYAQVRMNWDVFVDYVWNSKKRGSQNETNGTQNNKERNILENRSCR